MKLYQYIVYIFAFFLALPAKTFSQSYGLFFNSHEVVQEKRTSLDLSPNDSLCFSKKFRLEFELSLRTSQEVYFGYIVRILNGMQNIDIVGNQPAFQVVVGQRLTGLVFNTDTLQLYNQWNRFALSFDLEGNRLALEVNGRTVGSVPLRFQGNCFRILWGANDHARLSTRDLPPMRVKDIRILEQDKLKYHWSLTDTAGTESRDKVAGRKAAVSNPVWIRPGHLHWKTAASFTMAGNAAVAFNAREDVLYITGSDSVFTFRPGITDHEWDRSGYAFQNLLLGNQAIYDTLTDRLYDIFIDQHNVLAFNTASGRWNGAFRDTILTEYWHANKFISPADSSLYVLAGYGQLRYKNQVQQYSLNGKQWETISASGDFFSPRYLAALGTNRTGDTAYILGGYGSPTGDQRLNPGHYYDMYRFDVRNRSFKRLFALDSAKGAFVFANSLVLDGDGAYYGLIFRNGNFDTHLQLVKGSLANPGLQCLGDTIPYAFHDIRSFADLFYSDRYKKLLAVTLFHSMETDRVKRTEVKVYTIDFPPEPLLAAGTGAGNGRGARWWPWTLVALVLAAGFYAFFKGKRERHTQVPAEAGMPGSGEPILPPADEEAPAVHLFGQFQVTDRLGNDITKAFTPLLKELFLLILIHTVRNKKGITSEALDEQLWHDKPLKDAKNNRSVNIAKLKLLLAKLGEPVVAREADHWVFQDPRNELFNDYKAFMDLKASGRAIDRTYIQQLLHITKRGSFLQQTEYNWLDDVKSEVSDKIIKDCTAYLQTINLQDEAEFAIEIANCIFHFDRLNEDALHYKCKTLTLLKRHALANAAFTKFTREYKDIYGEEFRPSFTDILK